MASWDELNKSAGASTTDTGTDFGGINSWDEANKKAEESRSEQIQIRTQATESQQPMQVEEEPEPKGFFKRAVGAVATVGKAGLDVLNSINTWQERRNFDNRELMYGDIKIVDDPETGKRRFTTDRLDRWNAAETEEERVAILEEANQDVPLVKMFNSPTGRKVTGTVVDKTSNLPIKAFARIQSLGDKTYEDAYAAWLAESQDPSNPAWQKYLYALQGSGVQSLLGIVIGVGTGLATRNPKAGTVTSSAYYTALSAEEQQQERGQVESLGNIGIDVVGDQLINRALTGIFTKGSGGAFKEALKGFGIEGSTEISQSLAKYANDYTNARTEAEKNEVIENAKQYIVNGDIALEFAVGGTVGAGTGAIAGGLANPSTPDVTGQQADTEREQEALPDTNRQPPTDPVEFEIENADIVSMRDQLANLQDNLDTNDQNTVDVFSSLSDTLNDYSQIFNDKTVYKPSDTVDAPLLEVQTVRFPDGKFSVSYQANTDTLRTASVNNFTQTFESKEAATEAALQEIRQWAETQPANSQDRAADRQRILESLDNPRSPLPSSQQTTEGALGTEQLVSLRDNEEIYNLVTQDETAALTQIESAVRDSQPNLSATQQAELAADVYDTINDSRFTSIVRDLSLQQVIEQNQRVSERFQTEDQVEDARLEQASRDEMGDITRFMEQTRTGNKPSQALSDSVRALADKYGFRDGITDTELSRLLRLRINRDDRLSQMESELLAELDTETETATAARARREAAAKKKQEQVNEKEVKRLRREIPLLQNVPIEMVQQITTPTGRKAFGRFYQNAIQFTSDADVTTLPHESFHAFSQMSLTEQERNEMYDLARETYGREYATNYEIEESLAQDFANWYLDKRSKPQGFSQRLMEFFRKIADFVGGFTNKRTRKTLEDVFSDVLSKDAAKRVKTAAQQAVTPTDMQVLRAQFFNDPEEFTLRLFSNDVFKKDKAGYQEVKQAIKSMNLKGSEVKLHDLVLERPEFKDVNKFDTQEYMSTVKSEMLQIRIIDTDTEAATGFDNIGIFFEPNEENYSLPSTFILNTNFEHGKTGHFDRDNATGLHSHFRAAIDRDANAFKVAEIQSDVYQRGLKPLTEDDIRAERQKGWQDLYNRVNTIQENAAVVLRQSGSESSIGNAGKAANIKDLADQINLDISSLVEVNSTNIITAQDYLDFVNQVAVELERQESRIVYGELTDAEKTRIKQSEQFDSMKNLWYEQTIRTAIRKAAEKGAAFADFADTRTVANVEGYVGAQGQVNRAMGFGDDVSMAEAQVNDDNVEYLGEYPAVVVETMHDNNTVGIVYSPGGGVIQTVNAADVVFDERDRFESDTYNFVNQFEYDVANFFDPTHTTSDFQSLTESQLDTLITELYYRDIKETVEVDGKLGSRPITRERAAEMVSEMDLNDKIGEAVRSSESVFDFAFQSENAGIAGKADDFKMQTLDAWQENFDAANFMEEVYGENAVFNYFDKASDPNDPTEYIAFVSEGDIEYVEAPYGNTSDSPFDLSQLDDGHAGIAAKYGVNEINGKTKEGEYYKYLKKSRPDLELVTDDNGFTWWRTAVTDADMNDVPLFQEQTIQNRIDAVKANYPDVQIETSLSGGIFTLRKIIVPENKRNAGLGTKIMTELTTLADQYGVTMALTPTSDFGGTKSKLVQFYKRLGFVENKGRNKDFATRESFVRQSQGQPFFQEADADPQASSIYEDLAGELERVIFEIETILDIAHVYYETTSDYKTFPVSAWPQWIPKHLRNKKKLQYVLEKVVKGEEVTGSIQLEMYEFLQEHILNELPPALADEFVLTQYAQEQYSVADAQRSEALAVLEQFVRNLDAKMKKSATLRGKKVKKIVRTNTGQIRTDTREFSREMKKRARFFNRGYKTGYKQGAQDKLYAMLARDRSKRDRRGKIQKLKQYYKRVKQASRTGSMLPIDYQQNLMELFEAFDLTTMTAKTKTRLSKMQEYFAAQEGDVPQDIATKLERLDKIPVGKLSDDALEQIINEVTRIFENGVTKKRLMDTRDAKEFERVVRRVAEDTVDLSRTGLQGYEGAAAKLGIPKISYKLYDPTRFADIMDGSDKNYSGGNFKELVEPVRISIDKANLRTDSVTADAFAEIEQFGEQFSDEEMARMMYTMALEQGADKQAGTLAEFYKNEHGYDFVAALSEKERGAIEVMRRTFKEIRPEIAGAYEQINNIPFPDIENYFPLRYDREKELFNIEDQAFDFSITKTAQGFTIKRQPSVGRVLDINVFKTFANQLSSQIYYSEVQPQLDRTRSIINSPAYQSKLNRETQAYWKQFIEDVATRGRGTGDFIGKQTMDTLRGNVSAAILGYKLSTIMIQPSAVFDSMIAVRQELGTRAVLEIIPRFLKMTFSPAALSAASERSVALANRAGGTLEIQEMRNATRGIFSDSAWRRGWHTFKANAYAGIRFTDMRTAASVFDTLVKGYERKGMSPQDATKRAEQIMMLSQSSANVASRPQILNSASSRFFLPFQSFVINAFNNIRYDGVMREFKRNGKIRATINSISNMQFLAYAVAYEAIMYNQISQLFGYDDDEDEQSFLRKMFNSAIGRIPGMGFLVGFDGTFTGRFQVNNPAIEAIQDSLIAMEGAATGEVTRKEAYRAIKGMLILTGIPGSQQVHQVLTAPDVAGLGSIGMDLGIAYDPRLITEKQRDAVLPLFADTDTPDVSQETVERLATEVYGNDYTDADVDSKNRREDAIKKQIAMRQAFGFDDQFVNQALERKNNNEVKATFLELYDTFESPNAAITRYSRPVRVMGETQNLLSDGLTKELRFIANASAEDRERIMMLTDSEISDNERRAIIGADKNFAFAAYKRYGVISKDFFETLE